MSDRGKYSISLPRTNGTIPYLFIVVISCVCFAVYFNALANGFVYDDLQQVVKNQWIKDLKYIPEIFSTHVWKFVEIEGASNYYRPLMHIIYMMNYHLFGLRPWGFHLVNILFHAGVSILVFLILMRLLNGFHPTNYLSPPFLAVLLFVTHPIHTESVTWIAGLPDLSFTFFYLLSFYLYLLATEEGRPSRRLYTMSVTLFFLATLCKEPALTLPIILIGYDYGFNKLSFSRSPFIYVKRYLPYLIVAGLYFILRIHAVGGLAPLKRHAELSAFQYVINVFPLFIQYLKKLIIPVNLNAFHVFHPVSSIFEMKSVVSLILTAVFVLCTCVALRRNKVVFLSLLFITVPLLPALYIPAIGENPFAERYLYLPSLGFIILLALVAARIQVNTPGRRIALTVGFLVVFSLYSAGTLKRNIVWKNNYSLWTDTVRKSPDGALPHSELGIEYTVRGRLDEAIKHFETAIRLQPNQADYYNNLGYTYIRKGRVDKGIELFQLAIQLDSYHISSYYNLGLAYDSKGLVNAAVRYYQTVLRLNPRHAQALNSLGIAYGRKGMAAKAIVHFQAALKLEPDDPRTHHNLANAYMMAGLIEKAREHRQKARSLQRNNL